MIELFEIVELAQRELLLFCAFWLLVGGIDDLCIDLIWIVRRAYRHSRYYRAAPPMRSHELPKSADGGLLAIFIPAWREDAVIGTMLLHSIRQWQASNCPRRFYVGCYPNDNASVARVIQAACQDADIRLVLVRRDGPSTKANCLNRLWEALLMDEAAGIM